MRIDLNTTVGQTPEAAESDNSRLQSAAGPAESELPSDVTKLSPDYVKVQTLAAAISGLSGDKTGQGFSFVGPHPQRTLCGDFGPNGRSIGCPYAGYHWVMGGGML